MAGGKVAEFLRAETGEGREVIEQLVAGGQAEAQAQAQDQTPAESPAPAGPQREVIDRLVEPAGPATESTDVQAEKLDQRPAPDVDRGVIDELLGGSQQQDDESPRQEGDEDKADDESGKGA
jgi:hypothetical protein